MEQGLVYESRQECSAAGRRTVILRFNEKKAFVMTCRFDDIVQDNVNLRLCDLAGNVLNSRNLTMKLLITPDHTDIDVIREIISTLKGFLEEQNPDLRNRLFGIGLCVGGMVDANQFIDAPALNWSHLNLVNPLKAALHLPVFAEGITRIKALYEFRWLDGSEKNVIYLNLASGIGMVNFFNGKMVRGKTGIAGEIGHMSLNIRGPRCYCGNKGCFEYYCGMTRILERATLLLETVDHTDIFYEMAEKASWHITKELIFSARDQGRLSIYQLFSEVSEYLGAGIASIFNTFDPDHIVISGYADGLDSAVIENALIEAKSRIINKFSREINVSRAHLKTTQDSLARAIALFVTAKYLDSMTP